MIKDNVILKFENVSCRYDSDTDEKSPLALENINIDVHEGEFVAVLGHNGSGKSTLAKLCNAIITPEGGKVFVDGLDTSDEENELKIRQTVGVVLQNPDNQIVATIVEEDVAFGPENLCVPQEEIRKRVDDALNAVGMYEYRFHEPHKLSGGQKQRVAIAGVMAMQTKCIVLDEPTAMLDPRGRAEVMSAMKKLNKELGITIVLITHYMDEAVQADRIFVLDHSKCVLNGTPEYVFSETETIKKAGLDLPESALLADKLRKSGVKLDKNILSADDFIKAYSKVIDNE